MTPTYSDGDYVLTVKWPGMSVIENDIVVVNHVRYGVIVKRVSKLLTEDNKKKLLMLTGDNPIHSVSSQEMGQVNSQALIGKVLKAFKQQ